ncbi:MAG: aminodeoxychorismate lyase [Gammaproteobacteria bacterium]|nr:aminodeoxychorismate lyase [Gammaproteobacteria bacterium]
MLINGTPGDSVSVQDRGFQYGDGLFETIAVDDGIPLRWARHLRRLQRGAERLRLPLPDVNLLRVEADSLCRQSKQAVLKLIITRGPSARGYRLPESTQPTRVVSLSAWPERREPEGGASVRICQTRLSSNPLLAGIKHLNRLEQILARAEWADDYTEGLMLDATDGVIDGISANVFAVIDGVLTTPDLSHSGVAGIVREVVLERAALLGIRWRVASLPLDELFRANEVFLTNSLIGIAPVMQLEHRGYAVGEITETLRTDFKDVGAAT